MSDTLRGLLIFVAALVTIWLWAPLTSKAERTSSGTVITETYFGPLHYVTLHAELKEPHYSMTPVVKIGSALATGIISAALWAGVFWQLRKSRLRSESDRPDP